MARSGGDSRAECQRYLTEFRVIELKELLKTVGLSQKGRKPDLFQRAQDLLIHGSPKIQHRIRDIYERTHKAKKATKCARMGVYSPMKGMMYHHPPKSELSSAAPDEISYILHPDVKFKPHPFYQVLDSIIRPTALVSTAVTSSGNCSMRLQFHLTPQQVQAIFSSRTSQNTYGIQILLRFARKESSCEQEDFYPRECYVKVNSSPCALPGYNPHLSHRQEYKRHGSPVSITNYIKNSPTQSNDVIIYWTKDYLHPQGFCIAIDMVKSLSSSDLLQQLKLKGVRSPDVSRALVREKLAIDRDSEVSATSLRVSLLCPLGKMRMTHPCRSHTCTHLQCFDASIFLQMNERKARWVCPVCDKSATAENLVMDGLFKEICMESTSNDIEFFSDGSWHPISTKDGPTHRLTPDRRPLTVEDGPSPVTITDSSDNGSRGEGTKHDPIVIDLTSDDEEEGPLNLTSTVSYSSSVTSSSSSCSSSSSIFPFTNDMISSASSSSSSSSYPSNWLRDEVCRDGISRTSVSVKRRCSSTDGGLSTNELTLPNTVVSNGMATTTTHLTTALPVPVITEYAPSLPYYNHFLTQPSIQTVLASSDNSGTGGAVNLDDMQHLSSLNFDDPLFSFNQAEMETPVLLS